MRWNAYHFIGDRLRDGSPVPDDGVTLRFDGRIKLCEAGYHASEKVWQAVEYAPGMTLCRVYSGGDIIRGDDKLVSTERTIIARIDAADLLREYARRCALDVIDLWDAPDVVREYLETGDPKLRDAARAASYGARAWEAPRAAARQAAGAAWNATAASYARWALAPHHAARGAASHARWALALAAAWDAASDARAHALQKQRARLTRMVNQAFERAQ